MIEKMNRLVSSSAYYFFNFYWGFYFSAGYFTLKKNRQSIVLIRGTLLA
jgi:hypothetical protein